MTYDQIRKLLLDNKLDTLARDLYSAVEDEARALADGGDDNVNEHDRESARDFYAEDITACLRLRRQDRVITPKDILESRRIPTAKAIAFLMIEAGIKVPS